MNKLHVAQHSWFKCLFVITICIGLSGCDPFSEPESMTEEYLERLARVLEHDLAEANTSYPLSLPRPKDRRFELEPFKVNMLQFFSLFGCELQVLAGEKNSILGKVMTPSVRLDYELRFLQAADSCLEKTKDEPDLQAVIIDVVNHKKQQLPQVIWNAIWNNDEMANYLTYATPYLPIDLNNNSSNTQQLTQLNTQVTKLINDDYSADMSVLSELQYQWQYDSSAGQLLKTIYLLTERLNQANKLMASRLEKPICYQQKANPKAERMKNFFFSVYIEKIQPYIANIHQHAESLIPPLEQLASFNPAPSSTFEQYQKSMLSTGKDSQWHQFNLAVEKHTQHWQRLLEQCGMRPSANDKTPQKPKIDKTF